MRITLGQKLLLVFLIFFGVATQSITMVRSGLVYDFGMGFWGPNGHDGVWHLALINQVMQGFPPPHPTMAGEVLRNYHYFYDFLIAAVSQITRAPVVFLYFQFFPVAFSLSLGLLSFFVGFFWRKNFWTGFWLAFFNYFAGSFGYLVTLPRSRELGGESLFWSMQSISTQINPSFALSLVVLLLGMLMLLAVRKWSIKKIFLTGFLFGILIAIKSYAGVVGLLALGVFSLKKAINGEKVYRKIFLMAALVTGLVFLPINPGASSLFVFSPLWFVHSMIESTDRLYLPQLALARYYLQSFGIGPRLVAIEVVGVFLFLVGNLGTRVIGLWELIKRIKKREAFDWFLVTGGLIGGIMPLLFVQKGTAWNTIQFFYYFLFFANFYAAAVLAGIMQSRKTWLKTFFAAVFIIATVPTTLATFRGHLGWPPPAAVSKEELAGLKFLAAQKKGTVLTYPYDRYDKNQYRLTPIPLSDYESTAYVSAFSRKQTFLEDTVNLDISGYDWGEREKEVRQFFAGTSPDYARGFLLDNQIGYIYLIEGQKLPLSEQILGVERIYNQDKVSVYRVRGII